MSAESSTPPNSSVDVAAALANIPFQDPESASLNFSRAIARISPGLAGALPALLAESPDPDSALILFDRLVSDSSGEVVRLLDRHNSLAHYAIVIFGHSRFLGETLIQNPDLLSSFLKEKNLDRSFSCEELRENLARFRSRSLETDVSLLLAHFKRREYTRIMLRDVLMIAPLAETTAEISALADVLIAEALAEAERLLLRRYDSPQHVDADGRLRDTPFAVLSLGKLGGNELNYSSDVDLMFIFGDGAEPPSAKISNREYFIRLAQQVTEILSRVTREGVVYRIDLRLRPLGTEGELAIGLGQAKAYYATTAHDWEQQALIKVRYSAGDAVLARDFIHSVRPHIYTEKANFAAIKTALVARERMHKGRHRRIGEPDSASGIDVKIDPGGIRDIEFLVQCLQRVYGGAETWLRSGGTLFSLQKLHDKGHISGKEFHELTSAYEFLRHLEHRLQLRQGQQTHRLPVSQAELTIVQRSMAGYAPVGTLTQDFTNAVRQRMAAIAAIYQRIIYQQQKLSHVEATESNFRLHSALDASSTDHSNRQILERLATDAPALYETATRPDLSPTARKNLFRFLSAAFNSSEQYAAVRDNPYAFSLALKIFESSEYLTHILVRHTEEIATFLELADVPSCLRSGYLFESLSAQGRAAVDPVFQYLVHSSTPYGEKLSLLRQQFRHRVFAAGAKDIVELRAVYESLAATTAAVEDAIAAAFAMAGSPSGLTVMALGRLGSGEFDVLSDADLLFVCEQGHDRRELTKAAEQFIQALAAYTQKGMVVPVDTRLRPRGNEGELVVTPEQLTEYFEQEAQAWEALTYTKLRFLAGSRTTAGQAMSAAKILFQRSTPDFSFIAAVREMRSKLETTEKNFKTSPGGTYDIDFLACLLLIKHDIPEKGGTLRDRLWRCRDANALDKTDAAVLDHAAELLRTVEHVVRLVLGRARRWLPLTEHARQVTCKLTGEILGREFSGGLEAELERSCREVRRIYARVLDAQAR